MLMLRNSYSRYASVAASVFAVAVAVAIAMACPPVSAADWYVHADSSVGDNANDGSRDAPVATLQRAVTLATAGDTIHLLPEGALFRQTVVLNTGDDQLTIEGNGCTLSGADPIPAEGWQPAGEGLWKRRIGIPRWDRHLLIVDGRAESMGRTPSTPKTDPFPDADQLQPGQFRFDYIDGDEKEGWLTVRADPGRHALEWGTRSNGLATSGKLRGGTVRNLNARHCLNDGFNIHGDARELVFEKISGYDNYDEGFSAHDTCECVIRDSRFLRGDHAIADVNQAETHYQRCFFSSAINCNVVFQGGVHSLIDCEIEVGGKETALSISTSGGDVPPPAAELRIDGLKIRAGEGRMAESGGNVVLGRGTETTLVGSQQLDAPGGVHLSPTAKLVND